MKRILVVIKGLRAGGAERLLADGLRYRDRQRFSYEVSYALPGYDALVPEIEASGVPTLCLQDGSAGGWLRRLIQQVRAHDVDLVHVHSPYLAVGVRLALPRLGVPIVYTEHCVWSAYHPATRCANALTFRRNAHVFAVCQAVQAGMRPERLVAKTPVEVLYHGIDPRRLPSRDSVVDLRRELGLPPEAPLVTTVAAFRPQKGYPDLLQAALRVRRALPEVRFVLIGEGPEEARVRRETTALGLDGTIVFAGARSDAPAAGASGDVFTLASVHEGVPVALLEVMARGAPVAVTTAGGIPEVVRDGQDGLVVPAGDSSALADALVRLLTDQATRRRLGEAAVRRAHEFDIEPAVRHMEAVYDTLLR